MKRLIQTLFALALLALAGAQTQGPLPGLFGQLSGTEERLLYRKPAGPYTVTIDGERLLGRAYFDLDVRYQNRPIAEGSVVTVDLVPPATAGSASQSYRAVRSGDRYRIDPLILEASSDWGDDSWLVHLRVAGAQGVGETTFGMQVYGPKFEAPAPFSVLSVALPVVLVLAFLGVFALRGTRLTAAS